jgi:hypothetical protein
MRQPERVVHTRFQQLGVVTVGGSCGSSLAIVSSSDSLWAATSENATAPLNAFAVLASRIRSETRTGCVEPSLRTPAV